MFGGVAGGALSADPEESEAPLKAKIPGNMALDSARFPGIPLIMPPQGLEKVRISLGKAVKVVNRSPSRSPKRLIALAAQMTNSQLDKWIELGLSIITQRNF